jgi:signal transduction histidine kinase
MNGLQPLAEKREVTLELDAALALPDAWIDTIQMKRVFHNIISNAISYSRRKTTIRVSLYTTDQDNGTESSLMIEVSNFGKGIPADELPRIFDKYYSISRKFKQIGTGLGLYISKRIVELHGGKIWAISEPDKETRFFISLPIVQQVEKTATGEGSSNTEAAPLSA